jgi:hypothetical protein
MDETTSLLIFAVFLLLLFKLVYVCWKAIKDFLNRPPKGPFVKPYGADPGIPP